ncbi:MAG: SUMF1/EgtB/PvdO family nonheme iron enzyme [Akkermansia sp.]|nr:formylglycine-generating enzyme family protein [Akkermansia sp.]
MSAVFRDFPATMGDYTVTRLLSVRGDSELFLGTQNTTQRSVVLEVLPAHSDEAVLQQFLAAARAQAANELPCVGQVFAVAPEGDLWHIAQELPPGISVTDSLASGQGLSKGQLLRVLRNAARLYEACRSRNLNVRPLQLCDVFVQGEEDVRFLSPLLGGEYPAEKHLALVGQLAALLSTCAPAEVKDDVQFSTLFRWMEEGVNGYALRWVDVENYAEQIAARLGIALDATEPEETPEQNAAAQKRDAMRNMRRFERLAKQLGISLAVVAGFACLGLFPFLLNVFTQEEAAAGTLVCTRDGKDFVVAARPVSVREYREFLTAMGIASSQLKAKVNKNIPPQFHDHTPQDWRNMSEAATLKVTWNGRKMTDNSAVTNVTYWDALAYARYRDTALPDAPTLQGVRSGRSSKLDEWSATLTPESPLCPEGCVIFSAADGRLQPGVPSDQRSPMRSFRILVPSQS